MTMWDSSGNWGGGQWTVHPAEGGGSAGHWAFSAPMASNTSRTALGGHRSLPSRKPRGLIRPALERRSARASDELTSLIPVLSMAGRSGLLDFGIREKKGSSRTCLSSHRESSEYDMSAISALIRFRISRIDFTQSNDFGPVLLVISKLLRDANFRRAISHSAGTWPRFTLLTTGMAPSSRSVNAVRSNLFRFAVILSSRTRIAASTNRL